jgi:hypothetical protein
VFKQKYTEMLRLPTLVTIKANRITDERESCASAEVSDESNTGILK